jgi:hypothetical protein
MAICSFLFACYGIADLSCDEGHASIEWTTGIDGRRTHLNLGFE